MVQFFCAFLYRRLDPSNKGSNPSARSTPPFSRNTSVASQSLRANGFHSDLVVHFASHAADPTKTPCPTPNALSHSSHSPLVPLHLSLSTSLCPPSVSLGLLFASTGRESPSPASEKSR